MSGKDYMFVKHNGSLVKVPYSEVTHIGSSKDYCNIYANQKVFQVLARIDRLSRLLPPDVFFRCHRCFIVNVDRIAAISESEALVDGNYVPVARKSRAGLLRMVNCIHSMDGSVSKTGFGRDPDASDKTK